MRDLDKRALLTGDFFLVYGDIVSNMPLAPALAAHKARKAIDKNSIMTMVLRQAGDGPHRTKAQDSTAMFVLDPVRNRCLAYEQLRGKSESSRLELDADILAHEDLEIRTDLIDCGIDICTPDVLALWSDNFDYEAPRKGFLHSVLKDYELNGKKLHTYIDDRHYAARIRNLHAYDSISKDIIGQWAYPLVPDANLMKDHTYRLLKGNIYREEGVLMSGNCVIGQGSVIGRGTALGDGTVIQKSVVGRRCIIGRNVKLTGCYIWDDVTIGDGTVVDQAVIANEASVGRRCNIRPGTVISYGCHITDNVNVGEKSRITRVKASGKRDEQQVVRGDPDDKIVGQGGDGFLYADSDDDNDSAPGVGPTNLYSLPHLSISQESISTLHSDESESETSVHLRPRNAATRSASFGSATSDDINSGTNALDFHHEASVQIYESLQNGVDADNIRLELTSLWKASNANPHQVRRAVVTAFMKRIASLHEVGVSHKDAVAKTIPPQKTLLEKTMFDEENNDEKPDQVDFLLLMQSDLRHRRDGEKIMLHACNALCLHDLIDADGCEQWWNDPRSQDGDETARIRTAMQPFITVLLAEDSDEEESDDEEA